MNQITENLIVATVEKFIVNVESLTNKATRLIAMMDQLPGNLGRYIGQYSANPANKSTTIKDLIGAGSKARQTVLSACDTLLADAKAGNYTNIPADIQAAVLALQSANPAPNQAIIVLLELQTLSVYGSELTTSLQSINNALINLFRRTAVSAAASTTSKYKPISQEDAANMRQTICNALDVEIQRAGDNGEDESYLALRALRVAVVQDLTSRGASLSSNQTVVTPSSVPLLVTAQRLYQDKGRYGQLLNEANPIHPAFPPTKFTALLS